MGLPRSRVEEMLEVVSLTPTEASRRVGNYSLGMRQRLGIATALIGDPEALILDEPANGLDPAGIRWMRDLLRGYADRGGTVLLSSHLLHEIEVIADDIIMIGNGMIVSQGSKTELLHAAGTVVRAADVHELQRALGVSGIAASMSEDGALRADVDPPLVGKVALEAASPSPSYGPPTPASRTCSSSSRPPANEKEPRRDHHHTKQRPHTGSGDPPGAPDPGPPSSRPSASRWRSSCRWSRSSR